MLSLKPDDMRYYLSGEGNAYRSLVTTDEIYRYSILKFSILNSDEYILIIGIKIEAKRCLLNVWSNRVIK